MNFTEVPALQFKALSISAEDDGASAATVVDRAFGGAFASASMAELRMKQLQQQQNPAPHRGRGQSPPPAAMGVPGLYLNKAVGRAAGDTVAETLAATGGGVRFGAGGPESGPPSARGFDRMISTPRRRLRDALNMEKQICEQLLSTGWVLAVRAGKKIDGRYGLVSAYSKFPDVRVTVYQTQTSQLQELFFQHPTNLADMDSRSRKQAVFKFIDTLVFNAVGNLVPRPNS